MKTITINSQAEFDALKDVNGDVRVAANLFIKCDIWADGYIWADGNIRADGYIRAGRDIWADGYIWADGNIRADGYIWAGRDIRANLLYTSCIYPPKCAQLIVDRVVPAAGVNDRKYWSERFGIDTTDGCYDEFSDRLREALPRLKQMQNWSPLELLIIESHEGKYK